jgi:hypothetical protein
VAQKIGPYDGTYSGLSQGVERQCPTTDLTRTIINSVLSWAIYGEARQVTTIGITIKPDGSFSQKIGHGYIKGTVANGKLTGTRVSGRCTFRMTLTKH